jgi:hypothetical protein
VSASGKRWRAHICYDSKNHYLGRFDTKQDAALAYDRAATECGKDTLLNYDGINAAEEAAVQAQAEYTLVHDMCKYTVSATIVKHAQGFFVDLFGQRA